MTLKSFEEAFDANTGGCRGQCACGRVFYDSNPDSQWDWEPGEIEELADDDNATSCDGAVGYINFDGAEYVSSCDCWAARALQISLFIDQNRYGIIEYLKAEKTRKMVEASLAPVFSDEG